MALRTPCLRGPVNTAITHRWPSPTLESAAIHEAGAGGVASRVQSALEANGIGGILRATVDQLTSLICQPLFEATLSLGSGQMDAQFHHSLVDTDVTDTVVNALQAGLGDRLISVVLFGSRARQQGRADSDWDLLIIAEGLPGSVFARRLHIKSLLPEDCRGAVSILARTPEEFEAQLSSLYLDIALDGRVLYDPSGYIWRRLTHLRQYLAEIGLYRERTTAGDWWRWQKTPPLNWRENWLE